MPGYTLADLSSSNATKFAMQYLLPRVAAKSHITYGEIAEKLRADLHINGKIFPTHIGYVAGPLQNQILEVVPTAPLLNVLIVRSDNKKASSGVDDFLKNKYNISAKKIFDEDQRSALLQRAATEVYSYGNDNWDRVYERVFGSAPPPMDPSGDTIGTECDGQTRGGPAESDEHKNLKNHVFLHPGIVGATGRLSERDKEYFLLSGDEVDVFFGKGSEFWLVEVKSERSQEPDLIRGCYQSIKYRAVFEAQVRKTLPDARIHAVLVTMAPLPVGAKSIASDHGIEHVFLHHY